MRSLKAVDLGVDQFENPTQSMPSLQKDAAWRAVIASEKFVAYERQSSSL
jgi:hypothetical protein